MTRRRGGDLGGGFLLGVSLGLVFVPCAGPVLATITALTAQHRIGVDAVLLTLAYCVGAAVPMLLIALGGQRVARRLRAQSQNFRRAMGVLLAGPRSRSSSTSSQSLQTALGGYTTSIQKHVEETSLAQKRLDALRGGGSKFAKPRRRSRRERRCCPCSARRRSSPASTTGSTRPATARSRSRRCGGRSSSSTSGRTRASTASGRCRTCARGTPPTTRTASRSSACTRRSSRSSTCSATCATRRTTCTSRGRSRSTTRYNTWTAYSNQYWPADYLDRQVRARARLPLRRGRVRRDGAGDPHAARRRRAGACRAGHDPAPTEQVDARVVPRHGAPRALRRLGDPSERRDAVHVRVGASRGRSDVRGKLDGRAAADRRGPRRAAATALPRALRLHRARRQGNACAR